MTMKGSTKEDKYEYVKSELNYIYNFLYDGTDVSQLTDEQARIGCMFLITELDEKRNLKNCGVLVGGDIEPTLHQLAIFFKQKPEAFARLNFFMKNDTTT